MAAPLLRTKFYVPPVRPELVSRPRLIRELDSGLQGRLTLISAPAGFGKSTLLSEWVRTLESRPSTPVRVAWLSLDKSDNDPTRFWGYVITALQTVRAGLGDTALAALESRQPPATEMLLAGLINGIAEIKEPFVLVLDDFHLIVDPQVHRGVAFLLDNLPPQMHLVVASRADPPWPLARRRARGELNELRANDLRFTAEEAAIFLNTAMELEVSPDDLAALDHRTEGWIAGLQMAALSIQGWRRREGVGDVSGFIRAFTGSNRFILDYLLEEVLYQQSPDIREFLLKTSILDRLTGPLCDTVTGGTGHQSTLTQLEQANLFLVPLDDERRWYRYHHLFADLLRRRLAETERGEVPALHLRASEWYERNGLIVDAVSHASTAGDLDRVANLIEGNAFAMMDHGELMTLVGWLDALPDEVARSRPWLSVSHAWALAYAGHLDAVEPLLEEAEVALAGFREDTSVGTEVAGQVEGDGLALEPIPGGVEDSAEAQRVAGHIAVIRSYVTYIGGDLGRGEELARRALDCLPEWDHGARGLAIAVLGAVLKWSGHLVTASQASAEAVAVSQAAGDSHVAVHAICDLAALHILQGDLHGAAATCRRALDIAEAYADRGGHRLPVAGHAYALLSNVLVEWNEVGEALRNAREGLELCKLCGQADVLTTGYRSLAEALQATGDEAGALSAMLEGKRVASGVSSWYAARASAWEARLRLSQGDLRAASGWAQRSGLSAEDRLDFQLEYEYRVLARVLVAQGRTDDACGLLTRLLAAEEAVGATGSVIDVLVLLALARRVRGKVDDAVAALERALSLGEPQGYIRIFIAEGPPIGALLSEVAARGGAGRYAGSLLAAMGGQASGAEVMGGTAVSALIEPLSPRELEVLRLLRTDLSGPEIGEELCIAPSTVRSHMKSIYGKLDVHSRKAAVRRARELRLL